jgi:predicted SAM-dependent methyltransferase
MSRKLHIGGHVRSPGWEVLNVNPAPYVDHVCNATDLSIFQDATFDEIYASHVVEHLDYVKELAATLKEWRRVLKPGGLIYISVPDLDILAGLLLSKDKLSLKQRWSVMNIIFGGHRDKHDYHVAGLNEEFLRAFLIQAEYANIRKVEEFGLFEDTSTLRFAGVFVSLNMIAEKPAHDYDYKSVGRNEPCPCGSGVRFKQCHGKLK